MNTSRALVIVLFVVVATSAASAVTVTRTEGAAAVTAVARVNINTAGVKELMTLDGVGRGSRRRSSSTARRTARSRSRPTFARCPASAQTCGRRTASASW